MFHEDVTGFREVFVLWLPKYKCIWGDAHEYSLECPKINRSFCLNFNEKNLT